MDRFTIEMNYNRAMQQAQELDQIAAELLRLGNDSMGATVSRIQTNWQGANAEKYITKVGRVQGNISNISLELKRTATAIRNIARTTRDAEMRALELAKTRRN